RPPLSTHFPYPTLFRSGVDRAVRLDIDDQLVEVRALLDARALDRVRDAANRAERRVELQAADRPSLLLERRVLRRGPVAPAALEDRKSTRLNSSHVKIS